VSACRCGGRHRYFRVHGGVLCGSHRWSDVVCWNGLLTPGFGKACFKNNSLDSETTRPSGTSPVRRPDGITSPVIRNDRGYLATGNCSDWRPRGQELYQHLQRYTSCRWDCGLEAGQISECCHLVLYRRGSQHFTSKRGSGGLEEIEEIEKVDLSYSYFWIWVILET